MADLPLMTFSRSPPPAPPLALLPIRVTTSQFWSAMLSLLESLVEVGVQIEEADAEMAAGSQKVQKFLVLDFAKAAYMGVDSSSGQEYE
jgi:hypothetical protein